MLRARFLALKIQAQVQGLGGQYGGECLKERHL